MNYWNGAMNWPIDRDWECETCGHGFSIVFGGLTWGLRHGECRCDTCHTLYNMRGDDEERAILTTPLCMLKEGYKESARKAWGKYELPLEELSHEQWDEFMQVKALEEK